jgi:hypothetical protein
MDLHSNPQSADSNRTDVEVAPSIQTRRNFMQILSAAAFGSSVAGKLGSALTSDAPEYSQTITALTSHFEIDEKIRALGKPDKTHLAAIKKIADSFSVVNDVPTISQSVLRQTADAFIAEQRKKLYSLLDQRQAIVEQLHNNRSSLLKFIQEFLPGEDVDLGRLSTALGNENANVSLAKIQDEIKRENNELHEYLAEVWQKITEAAKSTPLRYDRSDGTSIYRKEDGGFSLNEKDCHRVNYSSFEKIVSLKNWSFSPEIYQKMPVLPNPRSLHCEHDALERELYKFIGKKVDGLLDSGGIPASLMPDLVVIRLNPLLLDESVRGSRYLEVLNNYSDIGIAEQSGGELGKLAQSPRITIAHEMFSLLKDIIDFDQLSTERRFSFFKRLQSGYTDSWAGPFAAQKNRRIIHEAAAESVHELICEGKLFFNNYPILDINQFKDIVRLFKNTPQFSEMLLSIYDRTLVKGIDMGLLMRI